MILDIKVARDTHGVRIYLEPELFREMNGLAPFACVDDGDNILVAPDPNRHNHPCTFNSEMGYLGMRFDSRIFNFKGLFATYPTEANYDDAGYLDIALPPLHELPWTVLRNGCVYDLAEMSMFCIAERMHTYMAVTGSSLTQAIQAIGIPDSYRRAIGHDVWRAWLKEMQNAEREPAINHRVGLRNVW